MTAEDDRLTHLLAWRARLTQAHPEHPMPSDASLSAASRRAEDWRALPDIAAFATTVDLLMTLTDRGEPDPVAALPDGSAIPDPVAGSTSAPPAPGDAPSAPEAVDPYAEAVEALRRWNSAGIGRGRPGFMRLGTNWLRAAVLPENNTVEALQRRLPMDMRPYAAEMSGVIAAALSAATAPATTPSASGPAPVSDPVPVPDPVAPSTGETRVVRLERGAAGPVLEVEDGTPTGAVTDAGPPVRDDAASGDAPSASGPPGADPGVRGPHAVDAVPGPPVPEGPVPTPARGTDPVPTPVGDPVAPPTTTQPASVVDPAGLEFAPFDPFGGATDAPAELQRLSVAVGPEGSRITWDPIDPEDRTAVYRVVCGDQGMPFGPDDGEPVATTVLHRAVDPRPAREAVRYYQVWVNVGATLEDAAWAQPRLIAERIVVAQTTDVDIRAEEAGVVGQWRVPEGTARVQVYRVPSREARTVLRKGMPGHEYRICADELNLAGFQDMEVVPGEVYHYLLVCEAQARTDLGEATLLSSPWMEAVSIPTRLEAVDDLAVDLYETQEYALFDLAWTAPPGGSVLVFRTDEEPAAGLDRTTHPADSIHQLGFGEDRRLAHPVSTGEDGRAGMRKVQWPTSWTRAYFTPVTVLDGKAQVGATVAKFRVGGIDVPRVVERVHRQILTFGWPVGADWIAIYRSGRGVAPEAARSGARSEISVEDYDADGGLVFDPPLPAEGCSIHLVPVAYQGGAQIEGRPATVEYPGLLRMSYELTLSGAGLMGTFRGRAPRVASVQITSEIDLLHPPRFVLVHHPERLPLAYDDGQVLAVRPAQDREAPPVYQFCPSNPIGRDGAVSPGLARGVASEPWIAEVADLTGFLRVFVDRSGGVGDPQLAEMFTRVALMEAPGAQVWIG